MFKQSTYKSLVNFNDPSVIIWANNVYDKLKQYFILPKYIKRESKVERVNIIGEGVFDETFDETFSFSFYNHILEDEDFTFGYKKDPAYTPGFNLEREVNVGKVHTIEFELHPVDWESGAIFYMSGQDYPDFNLYEFYYNTLTESLGFNILEEFDFAKVRIERVNNSVKVFINDSFIEEKFLVSNEDLIFDTIAGGEFPVANIKITRGDRILHWWKLNSPFDEGYNSIDFYGFWYSVCYLFSIINSYVSKWGNISENEILTEQFIKSRGIYYTQNSE